MIGIVAITRQDPTAGAMRASPGNSPSDAAYCRRTVQLGSGPSFSTDAVIAWPGVRIQRSEILIAPARTSPDLSASAFVVSAGVI